MSNFTILSDDAIEKELSLLPDWSKCEDEIRAEFVFPTFRHAMAFINLIAIESEVVNHHPSWKNSFKKVAFSSSTHDAGNKITDLDIRMAQYISRTASSFCAPSE